MPGPASRFRRTVPLYLVAVVGPTLGVLTLAAIAAYRQIAALDALRQTTERLQESSVANELERAVIARTAAALSDPTVAALAGAVRADAPAAVDVVHRQVPMLRERHPVARMVFVVAHGELIYPAVASLGLLDRASWLPKESYPATIERLLQEATALEAASQFAAAAAAHTEMLRRASTNEGRAMALAGVASDLEAQADQAHAAAAYRELFDRFGDTYSASARPFALVAALGLIRLGNGGDQRVATARRDLIAGRWSVSADQAAYFLDRLPGLADHPASSPFLDDLSLARTLAASDVTSLKGGAPDRVSFSAVGDARGIIQVAYRTVPEGIVGIVIDLPWVQGRLLPVIVPSIAPTGRVVLGTPAGGGATFRTLFPGWGVQIVLDANQPVWRRLDFLAFAAIAVVVVGTLLMGVVLLMRDVQRETTMNRLRADLVGGVSHELKTPLSVIRVYAETIEDASDVSPVERRRFVDGIVQETDRLRRIIDGVIDFSRIEQGERRYDFVEGDITPVLVRAVERFEQYASLHGFKVLAGLSPSLPPIRYDEMAIDQAVMNLLDNAFKYSGDATTIEVRTVSKADAVVVEVQDHGLGIAPGEEARIFERFHRGRHPDRGGYGLGLYLVRHIMNAHGGLVRVQSGQGAGSTFALEFPTSRRVVSSAIERRSVNGGMTPPMELTNAEDPACRG